MGARCYHRRVIVDFHTHIFPPEIAEVRDRFLSEDATFRELYEHPKAKLASADHLLASMEAAAIDVSVALGFAWKDADACRRHNDYLIDASGRSNGRLVPFCTLPLASGKRSVEAEAKRCVEAGVRGFGELRPDNLGFDLTSTDGDRLSGLAQELDAVLLFHVSEPVGHVYPGKQGLALASFEQFVRSHPETKVIGAHWAGGLAFYAPMPEVREGFERRIWVDTAASSLLYDDGVYGAGSAAIGAEHVLFGSDYPLLSQKRSRQRIEESGLSAEAKLAILGQNAAAILGLEAGNTQGRTSAPNGLD
jgi:predicted TIM-barrel fold metal-dependent hydrolase